MRRRSDAPGGRVVAPRRRRVRRDCVAAEALDIPLPPKMARQQLGSTMPTTTGKRWNGSQLLFNWQPDLTPV